MALRHLLASSSVRSRPRARAPTLFVAGVAALVAFGPAAAASGASAEPDADCDGVVNATDSCPTDGEDRDGHLDADGCPDPDNDRDLIADVTDACPDEAETFNDFEDGDGCPDAAIVLLSDRIELKQRIQFAFDTSEILARSNPILDEIAQAVRAHPEIGLVRIEGHSDDQGSRRYNQALSERRAGAVEAHLVGLGIPPTRLAHSGHGESQLRAAGTSEDARAENRRVEFLVDHALVEPRDASILGAARVRAGLRARPSYSVSSLITGCVAMSLAASQAAGNGSLSVEEVASAEPFTARSMARPFGMSLAVGGGVTAFADDEMREFVDLAGSWEARLTLGTRQRIAIEASYLGSVQTIDALGGLGQDAMLLSNGAGGALRLNLLTDRFQPYVLAGAAWRRYEVVNSDVNTSSVNDQDDVLETPFGAGFSYRYEPLIVDVRGVYRRVFYDDLIQPAVAAGQDLPDLHTWTGNLMAGFEF
jgi:outer membrane protein OmpA-like peptidoglycan-associated protein